MKQRLIVKHFRNGFDIVQAAGMTDIGYESGAFFIAERNKDAFADDNALLQFSGNFIREKFIRWNV